MREPEGFTSEQIHDFESLLSPPRFGTYLRAVGGDRNKAMELYCWNTQVSAALYVMLQFFELAVRNATVEALEAEFGPNWHLSAGFVKTLRAPRRGYQPREDLTSNARRLPTAGKVVAELKFAFWQGLFVKGQQARVWDTHFASVFPGYNKSLTVAQARAHAYEQIEEVRRLRNRVAHHEPIFKRDLLKDRDRIRELVQWRRPRVAKWLDDFEQVTALILVKPTLPLS